MLLFYLSLLDTQEDKDKFTYLYKRYAPLLKHVACQKLGDEQLAEDAVHNAFLNIIKNFHKIEDETSHKTRHFLVVVTENAAIDMLRKARHMSRVDFEDIAPTLSTTEELLDGIAVRELAELIKALPEIYRTALELRVYHGMSEKRIAATLDISYAAARKRLERARAMLAANIKKQQEGAPYESISKRETTGSI